MGSRCLPCVFEVNPGEEDDEALKEEVNEYYGRLPIPRSDALREAMKEEVRETIKDRKNGKTP